MMLPSWRHSTRQRVQPDCATAFLDSDCRSGTGIEPVKVKFVDWFRAIILAKLLWNCERQCRQAALPLGVERLTMSGSIALIQESTQHESGLKMHHPFSIGNS